MKVLELLGFLLVAQADEQVSVEKALEVALQWREEGRRDEAIELVTRITQQAPQYAAGRMVLGAMAQEAGELQTAIVHYDQAIALDPNLNGAYFNKGLSLYQQQMYPQAIEQFTSTLNIEPTFVSAWHRMGLALHFTGRWGEAEWAYKNALKLDSDPTTTASIHYDFAVSLQHAGKVVDSAEQYNHALHHSPNMTESWLNLAALHHKVCSAARSHGR
jgi:superkiller protein 3